MSGYQMQSDSSSDQVNHMVLDGSNECHASRLNYNYSRSHDPSNPDSINLPNDINPSEGRVSALEDAFSMGFFLDITNEGAQDDSMENWLPNSAMTASATSTNSNSSPAVSLPTISPATCYWLHAALASSSANGSVDTPLSSSVINGTSLSYSPNSPNEGRAVSGSAIDWKAVNETMSSKSDTEWKVIPQRGPAAPSNFKDNTKSGKFMKTGGLSSTSSEQTDAQIDSHNGSSWIQNTETNDLKTSKSEEVSENTSSADMLKRKAIISPEFVQYANESELSDIRSSSNKSNVSNIDKSIKQNLTGRRPSKKVHGHQGGVYADGIANGNKRHSFSATKSFGCNVNSQEEVGCKCTGGCRNARCVCVKNGKVCGSSCKCRNCRNPFESVAAAGLPFEGLHADPCYMQNLSKIKDMAARLNTELTLECCKKSIKLKDALSSMKTHASDRNFQGIPCPFCSTTDQPHANSFTYSWCTGKLYSDQKKPRHHCFKCKRCGDYRNKHCDDCGHCYFAGVGNSFTCSCGAPQNDNEVIPKSENGKDFLSLDQSASNLGFGSNLVSSLILQQAVSSTNSTHEGKHDSDELSKEPPKSSNDSDPNSCAMQ